MRSTDTSVPKPRVLYVDDQRGNLVAFRAALRRDAHIDLAGSGAEGLELMAAHTYALVISDQQMPHMTGDVFLSRALALQPEAVRMMLTAHADFAAVVRAINEGQISRLLLKPWDRDEMRALISTVGRLAEERREQASAESLKEEGPDAWPAHAGRGEVLDFHAIAEGVARCAGESSRLGAIRVRTLDSGGLVRCVDDLDASHLVATVLNLGGRPGGETALNLFDESPYTCLECVSSVAAPTPPRRLDLALGRLLALRNRGHLGVRSDERGRPAYRLTLPLAT